MGRTFSISIISITKKEKNRKWKIDSNITFLKSFHLFFQKKDWSLHFTIPFSFFYQVLKIRPNVLIISGYDSIVY